MGRQGDETVIGYPSQQLMEKGYKVEGIVKKVEEESNMEEWVCASWEEGQVLGTKVSAVGSANAHTILKDTNKYKRLN